MANLAETIEVRVAGRSAAAEGVVQLELRCAQGRPLPAFEPGAHVDVFLDNGLVRQYSLCNFQPAPDTYEIAVGLAAPSRGGSQHVHESIRVGDVLRISLPRNNFGLAPDASSFVFVAGGIGITPILSMIRWCVMQHRPWRLLYTARSMRRAAYLEQLSNLGAGRIAFHFDEEQRGYADMDRYLHGLSQGEHVYCCGPEPLMQAVEKAAVGHPRHALHFERFAAPAADVGRPLPDTAFQVRLRKSGLSLSIEPGHSILETLEQAGVSLPFACREGLCRSCETPVCAGVPDHRDYVLSDEERAGNKTMMICVSRSKTPILELDI